MQGQLPERKSTQRMVNLRASILQTALIFQFTILMTFTMSISPSKVRKQLSSYVRAFKRVVPWKTPWHLPGIFKFSLKGPLKSVQEPDERKLSLFHHVSWFPFFDRLFS